MTTSETTSGTIVPAEDEGVCQVRIGDNGSCQQHANVLLQGIPARGVIDTGADITIIGADLFRQVAAVARLKKKQLKKADKTPRTYDRRTFALDGKIDLDIAFDGVTMKTPVYIKVDAPEDLLLSEGVCRQLGIIKYHPLITRKGSERRFSVEHAQPGAKKPRLSQESLDMEGEVKETDNLDQVKGVNREVHSPRAVATQTCEADSGRSTPDMTKRKVAIQAESQDPSGDKGKVEEIRIDTDEVTHKERGEENRIDADEVIHKVRAEENHFAADKIGAQAVVHKKRSGRGCDGRQDGEQRGTKYTKAEWISKQC